MVIIFTVTNDYLFTLCFSNKVGSSSDYSGEAELKEELGNAKNADFMECGRVYLARPSVSAAGCQNLFQTHRKNFASVKGRGIVIRVDRKAL